jgi:hypothetical protein
LTGAGFRVGRINAKPARRIRNAVNIPNAIAPRQAQKSIDKSKRFAIF